MTQPGPPVLGLLCLLEWCGVLGGAHSLKALGELHGVTLGTTVLVHRGGLDGTHTRSSGCGLFPPSRGRVVQRWRHLVSGRLTDGDSVALTSSAQPGDVVTRSFPSGGTVRGVMLSRAFSSH